MLSVVNFCRDFRDDWKVAVDTGLSDKLAEPAKTVQDRRITSLFFRAVGVVSGLISLHFALKVLFVVSSSPLTDIIAGVVAAIFFALAHDCIMIGNRMRLPTVDMSSMRSTVTTGWRFINWGFQNATEESLFKGTWIVGPLQELFKQK